MQINNRELFLKHIAQTSPSPMMLEIERAEGVYIYDTAGNKHLDFISGISVSSVGHAHPNVIKAIEAQIRKYAHIMVYGETIQAPILNYAQLLTSYLPSNLNTIYFVNSGSEATEGAMKLAKGYTSRSEIISFENAYHGSTQGALSIMGNEKLKTKYRPLLPDTRVITFNNEAHLSYITEKTAAVFVEPIRAECGIQIPNNNYLKKLQQRCKDTGTLLVCDEIQTGFGRTGTLFAFEQFDIVPDILLLGKAMGGGLPIGAFISDRKIMQTFSENPPLGHMTTFGGNAVSVASALAVLQTITQHRLFERAIIIEKILKEQLHHPKIKEVRVKGALCAIEFESTEINMRTIELCWKNGLIVDWFLFADNCMRIAPPLVISEEELQRGINIILNALSNLK